MKGKVCDNREAIAIILDSPLGEIFDIMRNAVEIDGVTEREWAFNYIDVTFTVKVELKGDGVAE